MWVLVSLMSDNLTMPKAQVPNYDFSLSVCVSFAGYIYTKLWTACEGYTYL